MNYYTLTLIITALILLLVPVGLYTGIFEGIGQGFFNLHTWYIGSDTRQDDGGTEDTVLREDSEGGVLAVIETTAIVTAYTSSPEETSGDPCISASQVDLCKYPIGYSFNESQVEIDVVVSEPLPLTKTETFSFPTPIACPKKYDFGTIVGIENKQYICLDRMSSKYPDRFDIYFGYDKQGALNFGKQQLTIRVYQ